MTIKRTAKKKKEAHTLFFLLVKTKNQKDEDVKH